MAKNDRLYKVSSRHSWRKRSCRICGKKIGLGDILFSKSQSSGKTNYYCGVCALEVQHITLDQLQGVLHE